MGHGHGHGHAHGHWHQLDTSRRGLRALLWSFAMLLATGLAQLAVVALTGSVALLGDTIHNLADALTAVPLGVAFLLGRMAATRRYTYGLGRAEDLAGAFIVLLIAASAGFAAYAAVDRLLHPRSVAHLWIVAAAGVIGFAGNEIVARYRITVGRRIGSAALVADGVHARTDGFTSLAVVLGAGGVALGMPWADPIVGLLITVAILYALRGAAREVFRRLLDAVDPSDVDATERAAASVAGVVSVSQLRMRWIGHSLHAELAITVDPALTVESAHQLAHQVEHHLIHTVPRLTTATVHTEPAGAADPAHATLAHHRLR